MDMRGVKYLLGTLLAIASTNVMSATPAGATGNGIKVGAFAYVFPTDSYLTGLVSSTTTPNPPEFVVLNIGSGQTDDVAHLDATADALRARGITVYGYVDTAFGTRSLNDVYTDINRWLDPGFSNLERTDGNKHYDGIFLDQMPRTCIDPNNPSNDYRSYYSSAAQHVHDIFTFWSYGTPSVMANVGTAVEDCMPGFAAYGTMPDYYVTFEGSEADYNSSWLGGNVWNLSQGYYDGNFYFPNKFVHIVHTVSSTTQTAFEGLLSTADDRGAASVFVTNDPAVVNGQPSNAFDTRPNYYNEQITYAATLP